MPNTKAHKRFLRLPLEPADAGVNGVSVISMIDTTLGNTEWKGKRTDLEIQNLVGAMIGTQTNITVVYDTNTKRLNFEVLPSNSGTSQEEVEDIVNNLIQVTNGITKSYDDTSGILTLSLSGESYTSLEKTKLSLIEDGATADLTDAEVKTKLENNLDTNTVTDAEKIKLSNTSGINTGDQIASEVPVNFSPINYTPTNQDVEEHLKSIDSKLATLVASGGLNFVAYTGNGLIGAQNGVNTTFTVPENRYLEDILIFLNGQLFWENNGVVFTNPTTGVFDLETAPESTDEIFVYYKTIATSTGGSGGGLQSVVAGANVNVDNTDNLNPIVSAVNVVDLNTTQTVSGAKTFSSSTDFTGPVNLRGTTPFINLTNLYPVSLPITNTNATALGSTTSDLFFVKPRSSSFAGQLNFKGYTADREFIFPNKSGTVALLDDIVTTSLTLDAVPTDNSTNGVESNGVYESLLSKANDNEVVKLTGPQFIAGNKSFSGIVTIGGTTPTLQVVPMAIPTINTNAGVSTALRAVDDASGSMVWLGKNGSNPMIFSNALTTDVRTYTYPNKSGTIALLDDITSGGTTDHGALTGLTDDDHIQYYNQTRGDARYGRLGSNNTWVNGNIFSGDRNYIFNPSGTSSPLFFANSTTNLLNVGNGAESSIRFNSLGQLFVTLANKTVSPNTYNDWQLATNNTATRTYTLPNKSGTVAMLDDIPSGSGIGDITGSGTNNQLAMFTGTKTIANSGVVVTSLGELATVSGQLVAQTSGSTPLNMSGFSGGDISGSSTWTLTGKSLTLHYRFIISGARATNGLVNIAGLPYRPKDLSHHAFFMSGTSTPALKPSYVDANFSNPNFLRPFVYLDGANSPTQLTTGITLDSGAQIFGTVTYEIN